VSGPPPARTLSPPAVTFATLEIHHERSASLAAANRRVSAEAERAAERVAVLDRAAAIRPPSRAAELERVHLLVRLERHTEAFAAARALIADGERDASLARAYLRYLVWLGDYRQLAHTVGQLLVRR